MSVNFFTSALTSLIWNAWKSLYSLLGIARDTVLVIVIALIDYVFGTELVPDFLFKLVEDIRGDRCGVTVPVNEFLACEFVEN